jgi:transcriptional regulator with XRE-family HTH domain
LNLRQIIGDNVRCYRHKLEWSQQKLGTETGLHHDYIGRLERGLENVSVDNLAKLATAFNTDTSNLLIENYCSTN